MDSINTFIEMWEKGGIMTTAVTALVILLATIIVSYLAQMALRKLFTREGSIIPASSIFISLARAAIFVIGASILLKTCFGVDLYAVIAALGVGGLALSLGSQDTISNLIAGVQISLLGNLEPGDFIEINGRRGFVHDVSLRYTTITTLSGETVIVPNSVINSNALVKLPEPTVVKVPFYVLDNTIDLDQVAYDIVEQLKVAVPSLDKDADHPFVLYNTCGEFAIGGTLSFRITDGVEYLIARDEAIRVISRVVKNQKTQPEVVVETSAAPELV